MTQATPLTAAQVRELGNSLAWMLRSAGHDTTGEAVYQAMPRLLKELGIPLVVHTCTSTGQPLPFGRLAPEGKCPRCDERRAEKAAGIAARPAPGWVAKAELRAHNDRMTSEAIRDHFRPGGPHATGECGPVCTFADW